MDLALNNLQLLICHKDKPKTEPNLQFLLDFKVRAPVAGNSEWYSIDIILNLYMSFIISD